MHFRKLLDTVIKIIGHENNIQTKTMIIGMKLLTHKKKLTDSRVSSRSYQMLPVGKVMEAAVSTTTALNTPTYVLPKWLEPLITVPKT